MGEGIPREEEADAGRRLQQIPEGIPYTLIRDDEHGVIPLFFGETSVVTDLNDLARAGLIQLPTEPTS